MAETWHILGEGGTVFEMSLPLHETITDRLAKGYLKRVNADGTPWESEPPCRPGVNDAKAAWTGWAVAQGMKPDDAEALTKTDLIEKFGS